MTDGQMLAAGDGRRIKGGAVDVLLKVAGGPDSFASTFEVTVPPGYDVGAHVHTMQTEIFYVIEGHLDLLAFEPITRTGDDWHEWTSDSGQHFLRGGPGALLAVPVGCPHAFANPGDEPARMLFQAGPAGHEHYFEELAALLASTVGPPDPEVVATLRRRHDIEQLTPLRPGHPAAPTNLP